MSERTHALHLLAGAGSIAFALLMADTALAHRFGSNACTPDFPGGPDNCVSLTEDNTHNIYFGYGLSQNMQTAVRESLTYDYAPTDLFTQVVTNYTSNTDVGVWQDDYGQNGYAGWVDCPSTFATQGGTNPNRWCTGQDLRFNKNQNYDQFFSTAARRARMACHELGHTVGLRHWQPGDTENNAENADNCMLQNDPAGPQTLNGDQRGHINAEYGP